jgi:hypothetical protein
VVLVVGREREDEGERRRRHGETRLIMLTSSFEDAASRLYVPEEVKSRDI